MPQVLVFVLFFAGVYFLLLRPQQQRVRRQRELITAIGVGDRVVTAGGLIGRVVDLTDERLQLEIADGVVVELLRLAISRRLDDSEPDSGFGAGDGAEDEYDDSLDEEYEGAAEPVADTGEAVPSLGAGGPSGAATAEPAMPAAGGSPSTGPALPGPASRSSPPAAGPGGTIEEAATPAPGQDPI